MSSGAYLNKAGMRQLVFLGEKRRGARLLVRESRRDTDRVVPDASSLTERPLTTRRVGTYSRWFYGTCPCSARVDTTKYVRPSTRPHNRDQKPNLAVRLEEHCAPRDCFNASPEGLTMRTSSAVC
ncbi:hypothetical protein Bbelb_211960 [Branchiostoma belcheri]|nr:hypothetical protein Bbelb_211960 [Branchiostoma belcheri]